MIKHRIMNFIMVKGKLRLESITMKKTIPFMLSIIAIASIASTAVLGNTQTVYANNPECDATPAEVRLTLALGETSAQMNKKIDCFGFDIESITVRTNECANDGIDVSFDNIIINQDTWMAEETITNTGGNPGVEVFCNILWDVDRGIFGNTFAVQNVIVTIPEAQVGGEFLPNNPTALLLAGLQTSAIWIIPVLVGAAGAGAFYIKTRMNKE